MSVNRNLTYVNRKKGKSSETAQILGVGCGLLLCDGILYWI